MNNESSSLFIIHYGTLLRPGLWWVLLRFKCDSQNHSCRAWTGAIRLDLEIGAGAAEGLHHNAISIHQVWVTKYSILFLQRAVHLEFF